MTMMKPLCLRIAVMKSASSVLSRTLITKSVKLQSASAPDYKIPLPRQHEWNKAVSAAEKLVGFPTSVIHLRTFLNNDVTSMTSYLKKLLGSDHPILRTVKRLVYQDGKINAQVRGLIVLLLSRATSTEQVRLNADFENDTGVTGRQRRFAEIIEMIVAAQAIHRSVLNLPSELTDIEDREKDDLDQLEFGNKLAILGGDFLLARACSELAALRDTHIVEMIAESLAEFAQSEFIGRRDVQGRFVPSECDLRNPFELWIQRNSLAHANLMFNACKGAGMLVDLPENVLTLLGRMGRNISLALQAFKELDPYTIGKGGAIVVPTEPTVNLFAAPVLFHLENDPDLLQYVLDCNNVETLDATKVHLAVCSGEAIERTRVMCNYFCDEALSDINETCQGEAKISLEKLISYLKH